jgi:GR25 family glycosyltransferase involved in LPS biosynthesis|tara:strand:+ start:146 stop:1021 length:876 start_codon:yes stop_codon:yes gene_type:complete
MPKLKDYHILYINLDHRKDRRKNIESQLKKMHLMKRKKYITKRISGVLGPEIYKNYKKLAKEFKVSPEEMDEDYWMSRKNFKTMSNNKNKVLGRVGCFLAHLRALRYAVKKKLKNVIILEDDCTFIRNENFTFPKPPKNNDMFYIGGSYRQLSNKIDTITIENDWLQINPKKIKVYTTFGYGFSNAQSILNATKLTESVWLPGKGKENPKDWKSGKERIRAVVTDILYVNFIHRLGKAYILFPPLCVQSEAFISDITDFGKMTQTSHAHKLSYFYSSKYEKKYSHLLQDKR